MYLDGFGNVTCGVGHLLACPDDALKLPWVGADAAADWARVKASEPGHSPIYYERLTTCRLTEETMDNVLDADIAIASSDLLSVLPETAGWPSCVRQALLDMAFNLGAHRLVKPAPKGWPKMLAAMRAGKWDEAAKESHRRGIQDSRNEYVASLIFSSQILV